MGACVAGLKFEIWRTNIAICFIPVKVFLFLSTQYKSAVSVNTNKLTYGKRRHQDKEGKIIQRILRNFKT